MIWLEQAWRPGDGFWSELHHLRVCTWVHPLGPCFCIYNVKEVRENFYEMDPMPLYSGLPSPEGFQNLLCLLQLGPQFRSCSIAEACSSWTTLLTPYLPAFTWEMGFLLSKKPFCLVARALPGPWPAHHDDRPEPRPQGQPESLGWSLCLPLVVASGSPGCALNVPPKSQSPRIWI